jgi:hypothetical protein
MKCLAPCPACGRHVAIDAAACPFCSVALPDSFRQNHVCRRSPERLSRAALVAAGAALLAAEGCWSGASEYGVAVIEDASVHHGQPDGSTSDAHGNQPVDGGSGGDSGPAK